MNLRLDFLVWQSFTSFQLLNTILIKQQGSDFIAVFNFSNLEVSTRYFTIQICARASQQVNLKFWAWFSCHILNCSCFLLVFFHWQVTTQKWELDMSIEADESCSSAVCSRPQTIYHDTSLILIYTMVENLWFGLLLQRI